MTCDSSRCARYDIDKVSQEQLGLPPVSCVCDVEALEARLTDAGYAPLCDPQGARADAAAVVTLVGLPLLWAPWTTSHDAHRTEQDSASWMWWADSWVCVALAMWEDKLIVGGAANPALRRALVRGVNDPEWRAASLSVYRIGGEAAFRTFLVTP